MGKSFVYKWPVTKLSSDSKAFAKTIVENFKDLQVHLNSFGVSRDDDGTTVTLTDLNLNGDLFISGAIAGAQGPDLAELYLGTVQALTGGSWEQIDVDTVNGTSGPQFVENVATFDVTSVAACVALVVGQVEFNANESGYVRIVIDGVERARSAYNTRTGGQVTFIGRVGAGDEIRMEVFNDTAASVNTGSNATYLRVIRLFGLA